MCWGHSWIQLSWSSVSCLRTIARSRSKHTTARFQQLLAVWEVKHLPSQPSGLVLNIISLCFLRHTCVCRVEASGCYQLYSWSRLRTQSYIRGPNLVLLWALPTLKTFLSVQSARRLSHSVSNCKLWGLSFQVSEWDLRCKAIRGKSEDSFSLWSNCIASPKCVNYRT
jgi:hypothetical protein